MQCLECMKGSLSRKGNTFDLFHHLCHAHYRDMRKIKNKKEKSVFP